MAETEPGNSSAQTHPPARPEYLLALYATGTRAFPRWNLAGADLHGADLHDCNFFDANFTGANLSRADLSRANLSHAKLTNANLRGANLSDAFLDGADLTGADTTDMVTDRQSSPPQPPQSPQPQPEALPQAQTAPQSPAPSAVSAASTACAFCGGAMPTGASFCPACGKARRQISSSPSPASASGTAMLGGTKELINALIVGAVGILVLAICHNVHPDLLTKAACVLGDNGACFKAGLLNAIQQVGTLLGWLLAIAGFGFAVVFLLVQGRQRRP